MYNFGKIATFSTLPKMLQHHNFHLFQAYGEKLKMIRISLFFYCHIVVKSLAEVNFSHKQNPAHELHNCVLKTLKNDLASL